MMREWERARERTDMKQKYCDIIISLFSWHQSQCPVLSLIFLTNASNHQYQRILSPVTPKCYDIYERFKENNFQEIQVRKKVSGKANHFNCNSLSVCHFSSRSLCILLFCKFINFRFSSCSCCIPWSISECRNVV